MPKRLNAHLHQKLKKRPNLKFQAIDFTRNVLSTVAYHSYHPRQGRGLILLSCGAYGNVIRFLVPLTASNALVKEGMDVFAASLAEAVNRVAL
jgi:acetylornithine/succinyldiaminopimelate/putrescine aminotransferase